MKIPIRKTNRLVPRSQYPVICKEGHQWPRETTLYRWAAIVIDVSKPTYRNVMNKAMPKYINIRQNLDLNTKPLTFKPLSWTKLGSKPLTTWQNIKYHIIWWKK